MECAYYLKKRHSVSACPAEEHLSSASIHAPQSKGMLMDRAVVPIPAIYRCVAKSLFTVVPRQMSWVWQDWIPRGALSLVLGEPGIGKSFYALQLAAMVSRGWLQPPPLELLATTKDAAANEGEQRDPSGGTVVLFDGYDGEVIVQDRLSEMGACLGNVVLVSRCHNDDLPDENGIPPFDPKDAVAKAPSIAERDREMRLDLRSLEHHVLKLREDGHDVRLVIIDPIESLLRDSHDKGLLAKLLGEMAARLDVAMVAVGISTFSKGLSVVRTDTRGIENLFQVARTVVHVVQDLENEEQRLVLPTKLNLSAMRPGLKFSIAEGAVQWSNETTYLTGPEYLALAREMLKAFKRLGCRSNKPFMSKKWIWRLPGTSDSVWGTTCDKDPFVKGD